jgi:DNA-binding PadR family transcriptional regulator
MLRVLADGERHGYEIKKRVERILGGRPINNNVLYPALRRFEEQGAISRVAAQADPGRPPRNVYRLTDTGHDLLQAMIRDADPALIADDNEFQTRVAFFGDVDPDHRLKIISVRREIVEALLAHLAALRPDTEASPWGLRVMDFTVERYRHELTWLDALASAAADPPRPATSNDRPTRRDRRTANDRQTPPRPATSNDRQTSPRPADRQ